MSALAAILNKDGAPVEPKILEAMAMQAAGLGPDGISYLYRDNIGLAYLALNSTPESLHEMQPLESEEKRYLLVADARIDNRPELLDILRTYLPNHKIITDPDIILAGYRKWGEKVSAHLIGDFAFIIWDTKEQELFAARDTMQTRSLHYAEFNQTLCIATEARQILQHPNAPHKLNELALASWIIAKPQHHLSMFEGISPLPPGRNLKQSKHRLCIWKYWELNPEFHIRHKQMNTYKEQFREVLSRSINDRLRMNGQQVACEMSGGMDSSAITALTQQLSLSGSKELIVISHDYKKNTSCSELDYIKETAKHLHIKPHIIDMEAEGKLNFDAPIPTTLENPSYIWLPRVLPSVKEADRSNARVLLTGIGGDEMTWGHEQIFSYRLSHGDLRVILEIKKLCKIYGAPFLQTYYRLLLHPFIPNKIKKIKHVLYSRLQHSHPHSLPHWIPITAAQQLKLPNTLDIKPVPIFPNRVQQAWVNNLLKTYFFSMPLYQQAAAPFGIDVRHPFLDRRILEFVFAVPVTLWHRDTYPKWLLRKSVEDMLPRRVVWRHCKTDFSPFYKAELKSHQTSIKQLFINNMLEQDGLFDNHRFISDFDIYLNSDSFKNTMGYCYAIAANIWYKSYSQLR